MNDWEQVGSVTRSYLDARTWVPATHGDAAGDYTVFLHAGPLRAVKAWLASEIQQLTRTPFEFRWRHETHEDDQWVYEMREATS